MSQKVYYKPKNPVRVVVATSLFDGHDASINIMRRILQDMGAEVIHLGHNRSTVDVVKAALQEGAQSIAVSSYQGGHIEYFKYMKDLLDAHGAFYVKIFGGGGGVIVHEEKKLLEDYGIVQIFNPEDGRKLGLKGMIEKIIKESDFNISDVAKTVPRFKQETYSLGSLPHRDIGLLINDIELKKTSVDKWAKEVNSKLFKNKIKKPLVLGLTGTGGAGKSSLIDELLQRFLNSYEDKKIAVVCVDPTKRKTGGSLLGDRIRMNSLSRDRIYMRSLASRGSGTEISGKLPQVLEELKKQPFDLILAESSGIGQGNTAIIEVSDLSLYVMTSEFGAQSQLEKIDMIDFADIIAINKADKRGSEDALRDVKKQYTRSRNLFSNNQSDLPVHLTQASNFNDEGINNLFKNVVDLLIKKDKFQDWKFLKEIPKGEVKKNIIPSHRQNYLAEISNTIKTYHKNTEIDKKEFSSLGALRLLKEQGVKNLDNFERELLVKNEENEFFNKIQDWDTLIDRYKKDEFSYTVRGKEIKQSLISKTLSGINIPRVVPPNITDWGDRYEFLRKENFSGEFPYTAGVFPLKRQGEDPGRQFAGEGSPERTNKRFHYLSGNEKSKRLSTAFDSVTLYGQSPHLRPDIYGKVGESGVSIASLEDMKRLYKGFDLCDSSTSVSMTINGPAPIILAYFMNTAIDQYIEKKEIKLGRKFSKKEFMSARVEAMQLVRGTVQADILKEDQGQNTCIFSTDFALKMMGDIQQYFIDNSIRNFYSVSISGYHIAEAGANPITQLALTLSNAFTYVEYYLSRGMKVDEFASSLSFFFSNGLDTEYSVIGRVARRIWAVAMRDLYKANSKSQKLKYHIQTSGRSLHAQEIQFNDIRTTLQALTAINDNCNSLHTNAYDEAITTPTEESVRRAQAIQFIINKELGSTKNENTLQGSYFYEWLTDKVEDEILLEFHRISERGGVLGAMENQYQRGKIQEESMYYEMQKHDGTMPIVGVNFFVDEKTLADDYVPKQIQLARALKEEKALQLRRTNEFLVKNKKLAEKDLKKLKTTALLGGNVFEALMEVCRTCTLAQITDALFEVGGQYRRNL